MYPTHIWSYEIKYEYLILRLNELYKHLEGQIYYQTA